jgi:hypothetical protein
LQIISETVRKRESTEKIPMRVLLRLFHLEDLLPLTESRKKRGKGKTEARKRKHRQQACTHKAPHLLAQKKYIKKQ